MSALARYMNNQGIKVAGYDQTETKLTRKLVSENIEIHYEDDVTQIPENIDLVVYTPAIPENHQELNYLQSRGYVVMKRAEVLGLISQSRQTIAVGGTHGKTTTSTILTHLLRSGEVDCTAFLGGIAQDFGSNYVEGKSNWVVVEADEYDRSFLHLRPDIAIILSMDADHLDIYGDDRHVVASFRAFATCIKDGGLLLLNEQFLELFGQKTINELKQRNIDIRTYGLKQSDHLAHNIRIKDGFFVFDYKSPKAPIKDIAFSLPGHHNTENATAAIAAAQQLEVSATAIKNALASFKGIKRRFEIIYRDDKVVYIDDYAHHPSELKAAIAAAKSLFPEQSITGVFQPHLFSRTRDFAEGFSQALDALDEVWLLDIYPAREKPIVGVSSENILSGMKNLNKQLISKEQLLPLIQERRPEVLLTLGAGDIGTFVEPIKELLSHD